MYYGSYLELDKILDAQHPVSFNAPNEPAHDEMLFIVIHQAYELWFKQILFELDYVLGVFSKDTINDNAEDMNLVLHRLNRVKRILELLNQQVHILDTMTPLDFLEFRNLLTPSSGFQSKQFRLIEAKLGLEMDSRHQRDYYKRTNEGGFTQSDFSEINAVENETTLLQRINTWLERMPFFDAQFWKSYNSKYLNKDKKHPFWNDYRYIYQSGLTERESTKIRDFDYIFFDELPEDATSEEKEQLRGARASLSATAMRSALFIMLYRDYPVFQHAYRVLDSLVEIDSQLAGWRHKHYMMVRRMIGMRVGTGNTSGAGYLQGALSKHYVFRDIAGLSTFLIERKSIPVLPDELRKNLGLYWNL